MHSSSYTPTYQLVTQKLKDLKWTWNHPRVVAYIRDLSALQAFNYTPSSLPSKHYKKIMEYLEIYERIQALLKADQASWEDISHLVVSFSTRDRFGHPTNRLNIIGWRKLEEEVRRIVCPF